jgi:hypothetical protein
MDTDSVPLAGGGGERYQVPLDQSFGDLVLE